MLRTTVSAARFNRALSRLFRIADSPSSSVAGEIQPVCLVAPDSPDLAYLREEYLFQGAAFGTAVAAQFCSTKLLLPTKAGVIATCEYIVIQSQFAVHTVTIRNGDPTQDGTGNPQIWSRDSRIPNSSNGSVAQIACQHAGAFGNNGMNLRIGADVTTVLPWAQVLMCKSIATVGVSIEVVNNTINDALLGVGFLWRERVMTPDDELA